MRGGIIGLGLVLAALGACDVIEKPLKNSKGLVSKGEFRKAVTNATIVSEIPMRGQALIVSRADLTASSFAVLQFVPKYTTRRDQPDMSTEVLPVVERITGCEVVAKGAFGPGYFMPRERDVVVPISCSAGFDDTVINIDPVVDQEPVGEIIELPVPEAEPI